DVADEPAVEGVGVADASGEAAAAGDHLVRAAGRPDRAGRHTVQLQPQVVAGHGEQLANEQAAGVRQIETGADAVRFESGGAAAGDAGDLGHRQPAEQVALTIAIDDRHRPERLGRVGEQLGQRPGAGEGDGHRHADDALDVIADGLGALLPASTEKRDAAPEELVDRIVLDGRREGADLVEHLAGKGLVPVEVAFDVDAVGAQFAGLPDRLADGDAVLLHGVAAGDDAGALVAEDADGEPGEPGSADDL